MKQTIDNLTSVYNDLISKQETVAAHHIARAVAALGGDVFKNATPGATSAQGE